MAKHISHEQEVLLRDYAAQLYQEIGADLATTDNDDIIDVLRDRLAEYLQEQCESPLARIWQGLDMTTKMRILERAL